MKKEKLFISTERMMYKIGSIVIKSIGFICVSTLYDTENIVNDSLTMLL
jgi:hypothetical protein